MRRVPVVRKYSIWSRNDTAGQRRPAVVARPIEGKISTRIRQRQYRRWRASLSLSASMFDQAAAQQNRLVEHDILEDLRLNGNVAEIRDVSLGLTNE